MQRSWKTIAAGSLYPLAKLIENYQGMPHWCYFVGQALEIVAVFGLGVAAKDYDKSDGSSATPNIQPLVAAPLVTTPKP